MTVLRLPETDFTTASTQKKDNYSTTRKYIPTEWFPHMPADCAYDHDGPDFPARFFEELIEAITDWMPGKDLIHVFLHTNRTEATDEQPATEEKALYVVMLGELNPLELDNLDFVVDLFIVNRMGWRPGTITMVAQP